MKVRSWTRLPGDPQSRRTGGGRKRTVLMEGGVVNLWRVFKYKFVVCVENIYSYLAVF